MLEDIYIKVHKRVSRRLSRLPYLAAINALLFTLFTVPAGFLSYFLSPYGSIDGVVYWTIVGWSFVLLAHVGYVYGHSAAREGLRERTVREEVFDAGDDLALSGDELMSLHRQLLEDVQTQPRLFRRLMFNALGNLLLWPGMLIAMVGLIRGTNDGAGSMNLFIMGFFVSLLGTLGLGFTLPIKQLFRKQAADDDVRAFYGAKRKRKVKPSSDPAVSDSAMGSDDELVQESVPLAPKQAANSGIHK